MIFSIQIAQTIVNKPSPKNAQLNLDAPPREELWAWWSSLMTRLGSAAPALQQPAAQAARSIWGTSLSDPSVSTDKADYAPGETVWITASNFTVGSTVRFNLADDPRDVGDDGDRDIYESFYVTDGGAGDLDGEANGVILTSWFVPLDDDGSGSGTPDALNATLLLTAQGRGTGERATTSFTDSAPPNPGAYTAIASNQKGDGGITAWDPTLLTAGDWRNGAVGGVYSEGSSVAFKAALSGLTVNSLYYIDLGIDIIGDSGGSFGFTSFKPIGWRFPALYANKFPDLTGYVAENGFTLDTASFLGSGINNIYSAYQSFDGKVLTYRVYFTAISTTANLIYGAEFAATGLELDANIVGLTATGYADGLPSEVPTAQGAKTVSGNFGVNTTNFGNETLSFSGNDLVGTLIWPLSDDKTISTPEDVGVAIVLTGSDPNNDNDSNTTDVPGTIDFFRIKSLPLNGALYTTRTTNSDGSFTYSGAIGDEGLVSASTNTVTIWFVPSTDWSGSTSFQYAAVDNDRLEDKTPATVAITVTPVDDPPVAGDDTGTAVEQGGLANGSGGSNATGNVLSNDSDVDNTAAQLAVSAVSGGAAGTLGGTTSGSYGQLTLNSNGSYTYVIDNANANVQALNLGGSLSDTFTYTLTDGASTDTATLVITIQGANDAPEANPDSGSATEKGGLNNSTAGNNATGNVLTNDSDVDNTAAQLVVAAVSGAAIGSVGGATAGAYGTLSIAANGAYTYTINDTDSAVQALKPGGTLTDTFTYSVSDGSGGSATASLQITINGAEDLPSISGASSGSATEKGGVANGTGGSNATGNLDFSDPDDAGTADSWSVVAAPAASSAGYGSYTIDASGNWIYVLNDNLAAVEALDSGESLSDSFAVFTAGNTASQTVSITIIGADDAPTLAPVTPGSIAENDQASTTTDSGLSGTLAGADVDGETLTYGISGGTGSGSTVTKSGTYGTLSLNTSTGAYSYAKNAAVIEALDDGESGSDSFSFTVSDGDGASVTQTYTVNVSGADDAPTLAAVTAGSIAENDQDSTTTDSGLSGTLAGADVDVETLTYGIQGETATGGSVTKTGTYGTLTLNTSTGAYSFAKNAAAIEALDATETGSDSFSFTVFDGDGALVTQTYTVNVSGADDAPTLAAVTAGSIAEITQSSSTTDSGLSGTLTGADVDGETLTYGIDGGAAGSGTTVTKSGTYGTLSLNTATGTYSYAKNTAAIEALAAGQTGSDAFTFTVSDGDGASVSQSYTVNVTGGNDAPSVSAATDVNGAVSELADGAAGENSTIRSDSGSFSIADVDLADIQSVSVTASSSTAPSGTALGSLSASVANNTTSDGSGTVTWSYQVADSALDSLAGSQTLTETFTITVADGKGGTVNQTVTVTVTGSNDAPNTNAATASGLDNADWIAVALGGSDVDGSVASFEIQSLPAVGSLYASQADAEAGTNALALNASVAASANSATLYFVPVLGSSGAYTVQYAAIDAQGAKDASPATATITVALSNIAPTTNDASASGQEDASSIAISLSGADSDGTVTDFKITSLAANGTLYSDAALTTALTSGATLAASANSATVYFVPNANWNGSTSFGYAAIDDDGAEDATPATAQVTVTAVNDAPSGTDGAVSGAEDTAWITVVLAATDVDNAVAQYRITSLPSASLGTLYRTASATADNAVLLNEVRPAAANGTVTLYFKPLANANGSTSVSFVAIDASGLEDSSPATTTITVTEVNDAPVLLNETLAASLEDGGMRPITFAELLANDNAGPNEAGQSLTITSLGTVAGGTAVLADTNSDGVNDAVLFTPTANFAGAAYVDYVIRDNGTTNGVNDFKTATGRASFTITQVNDAPSFLKGADQVVLEDAAPVSVSGWATALNDGDTQVAQTLSFVVESNSNPTLFSVGPAVSSTGTLTYTLAPNAFGTADISIRLTDNGGTANGGSDSSAPQTFKLTANPVNDAPVALDVASPSYTPIPTADVVALSTSIIGTGIFTAEWFLANDRSVPGPGTPVASNPSLLLKATDVDGSDVEFRIDALPPATEGTLYFDDGSGGPDLTNPVLAGTAFAASLVAGVWQSTLHFEPADGWIGETSFSYSATDAGGQSTTANASIGNPVLSVVAVRGLPPGLTASYDSQGRLIDISGNITGLTASPQTYNLQYDLFDGKTTTTNIAAYLTVFPSTSGANLISLNTSPETINGNYTSSYIEGGAGNDTVNGSATADWFRGGTYSDRLVGNAGNDTLIGDAGLDTLIGGDGNDQLQGGAGVDTLTGGVGADRFYYEALNLGGTTEVITDFNRLEGDKLVFDAADLGLSAGTLNSANFAGYVAAPTAVRQFFLTRVGTTNDAYLYWDSNGIASGGRFTIARITGAWINQISAVDFTLI